MSTQPRMWSVIVGIGLISLMIACALPSSAGTATPTPGLVPIGSKGSTGNGNSGTGNGGTGGSNGGTGNGNNGSDQSQPQNPPNATETPPSPVPNPGGPYAVKQIMSLGGERISGFVCSLTQPFIVNAATSKVAWVFNFVPQNASQGNMSYAYSIPSAGETHNATGKYTISPQGKDGTLRVSLNGSDQVAFNKFNGKFPISYSFDLVPSGNTSCPGQ